MKTTTNQTKSPFRKNLLLGIFLLCGITFSSFNSSACTAAFTYSAGVNGHYTFTSTSYGFGGGIIYSWNAGDGSGWQNGSSTFNHIFTTNGTFHVKLAANDSLCYDTATVLVTVSNVTIPCTLAAGFNVSYGAGGQVTFTSTSAGTNAYTFYYWAPGDSNQRYQEHSVYTHTYLWNGYYTVWLTVEDTGNAYCIDSTSKIIEVTNADSGCHVHPSFTYTLDTNGQVTLHSTSRGVPPWSMFEWTMGDTVGQVDGYNDSTIVYTYAYNGTHYVTLYITSDSSVCGDSITIPVTVSNACNLNVNFTYQYDSSGQVKFTSTTLGAHPGAQYGWSFGDSTSVNASDTVTHAYPFIGNYNVTLTVVNPGGCTVSYTLPINIYNKDSLQARFIYHADTLNAGKYHFTSTSRGTDAYTYYKWIWGDATPSDSGLGLDTASHVYYHNGPYNATLTIWYTILPHSMGSAPRYDLSSYTLVINVTTSTGLQTLSGDSPVYNIYPNPNDGSFNISVNGLANEKNAEIRISNMMGQVIYQSNAAVNGGKALNTINLQNAANGIYLLQIITADNTYTSRIAIQK